MLPNFPTTAGSAKIVEAPKKSKRAKTIIKSTCLIIRNP
jgi:hypothetical protein